MVQRRLFCNFLPFLRWTWSSAAWLQVEQYSVAKDAVDVVETWHGILLCVGRAALGMVSWMNLFLVSPTALLVERGGVCVSL